MHLLIWLCVVVTCCTFCFDIIKDVRAHVQFGEVLIFIALVGPLVYVLLL